MGDAEFTLTTLVECIKMGLQSLPDGTTVHRVQPSSSNCLSDESCVVWNKGKLKQDMDLRLRNVECGEVQIQIEWIDVQGDNVSAGDGTCFIQEYMIPRGSSSFCVYDISFYGEPVWRFSDNMKLKANIRSKARQSGHRSSNARRVSFVIFIVNGLSIMEVIYNDNEETRSYTKRIASEFNNHLLSYKDDKHVVVVTHGDLLTIPDRARVRIHLGELFGIPPQTQFFDIPVSTDPVTKLSIVDMILYCLERADRNLIHVWRYNYSGFTLTGTELQI